MDLPQQAPMFSRFWLSFPNGQEVTGQKESDVRVFIPAAHCPLSVSFYSFYYFTPWKIVSLWIFFLLLNSS